LQTYIIENSSSTSLSGSDFAFLNPQKIEFPSILGISGKSWHPSFSVNQEKDSKKSLSECFSRISESEKEKVVFCHFRKWARHRAYQELIDTKAARFCHQALIPLTVGGSSIPGPVVDIRKLKNGRFNYSGLVTCGSVWNCAVCAAKISEKRRLEMTQALKVAYFEKGLDIYHLTLTAPHYRNDSLRNLLGSMIHARRLMLHRKPWNRLIASLGVKGTIKALEVTHGLINGWHVHFHVLMVVSEWLSDRKKKDIEKLIFEQWRSACLTAGLESPSKKHGVKFEYGERAGDYVGKWGAEHEIAKSHLKSGREGNLSPFEFLDKYIEGNERYKDLFLEYSSAFRGKRQLIWSDGLRDYLKVEKEKTDEEIALEEDPDSILFTKIPLKIWRVILAKEKRAEVLDVCLGGLDRLNEYLENLMKGTER